MGRKNRMGWAVVVATAGMLGAAPVTQGDGAPSLGAAKPDGAVQLVGVEGHVMVPEVEGSECGWVFAEGVLTASQGWDSVVTPEAYGDFHMHVEFKVNDRPDAPDPEANGNSGIYIQQRYELQIHQSHGVGPDDFKATHCASLYKLKQPDRRVCLPPGVWQSYDIWFRAARFDGARKVENARITVDHNGVRVHDDFSIPRKTGAGQPEGPEPRPIKLQGHQNPVQFRNVWIERLDR